jgi:hypothetical protein
MKKNSLKSLQNYGPFSSFPNENHLVNKSIVNFYLFILSSCSMIRASVLLASVSIGMLHAGCRSSNQAFVQYQRPAHTHDSPALAQTDTIPKGSTVAEPPILVENQELINQINPFPGHRPTPTHVRNPEAHESKRPGWMQRVSLNTDPSTTEYAPRREAPLLSTKRTVPGLVKGSLAGAIVSQGLLLFGAASGTLWLLAVTLPLASVLVGIAGLAKISRRREEYRGKGWAMSAIMLATGALGLALVAAAALATSEVVWK